MCTCMLACVCMCVYACVWDYPSSPFLLLLFSYFFLNNTYSCSVSPSLFPSFHSQVDEYEKTQKEVFLTLCQKLIAVLGDHLARCDQEGVDYESPWFQTTLDNCRQLLVKVQDLHTTNQAHCTTASGACTLSLSGGGKRKMNTHVV